MRLMPPWHRPGPVGGYPADAVRALESALTPPLAPPSILVCSAWLGLGLGLGLGVGSGLGLGLGLG